MDEKMKILRFYASNTDRIGARPLYQHICIEAKNRGMLGATVYKGLMGFGASSKLMMDTFWEFTEKIPVVVEIIDTAEKIDSFIEVIRPVIEATHKGCLVVAQDVDVVFQKKGKK